MAEAEVLASLTDSYVNNERIALKIPRTIVRHNSKIVNCETESRRESGIFVSFLEVSFCGYDPEALETKLGICNVRAYSAEDEFGVNYGL